MHCLKQRVYLDTVNVGLDEPAGNGVQTISTIKTQCSTYLNKVTIINSRRTCAARVTVVVLCVCVCVCVCLSVCESARYCGSMCNHK